MAITIQKSKINGAPVIFGADADTAKGVEVKFGYGTLENVLAKIGTADDGVIYFGYDEAKSTGAIVSRGKLVSSKILDITTTAAVTGRIFIISLFIPSAPFHHLYIRNILYFNEFLRKQQTPAGTSELNLPCFTHYSHILAVSDMQIQA